MADVLLINDCEVQNTFIITQNGKSIIYSLLLLSVASRVYLHWPVDTLKLLNMYIWAGFVSLVHRPPMKLCLGKATSVFNESVHLLWDINKLPQASE